MCNMYISTQVNNICNKTEKNKQTNKAAQIANERRRSSQNQNRVDQEKSKEEKETSGESEKHRKEANGSETSPKL